MIQLLREFFYSGAAYGVVFWGLIAFAYYYAVKRNRGI